METGILGVRHWATKNAQSSLDHVVVRMSLEKRQVRILSCLRAVSALDSALIGYC